MFMVIKYVIDKTPNFRRGLFATNQTSPKHMSYEKSGGTVMLVSPEPLLTIFFLESISV